MYKKGMIVSVLLLFLLPIVSANNLRVTSTDYVKNVDPCKPASFSFSIENIGTYTETYYLGVDKLSEYAAFSQNPVTLNPSTSQELFAFINADCDTTGSYNLNIIVRALNSRQEVKLPIQLNIIENYDYDLFFGDYYVEGQPIKVANGRFKICEEDVKQLPVIIQNKADVPNSYKISLRGPGFASLTQNSAILNGLQEGAIFINLEPKFMDRRTYSLTTYITSQRGNIKKKGTIILDVEECFKVDVELPKEAMISNCEKSLYNFSIKNIGNYDESFNLYLEAPSWVSIDYDAQEIDANSKKEAVLNLDAPCNKKGTERITIKASSQDHENIEDEKTISMEIIPKSKFYYTVLEVPRYNKIRYNAEELPIKITNNGLREVQYLLSLTAPDWIDIEPRTLPLEKEETANPKLVFDINESVEEGDYDVIINANANGAEYSKEIKIKLRKEYLPDKIARVLNWIEYYLYYLIAGVILIAILIPTGIHLNRFLRKRPEQVKSALKWAYMVLAGIIVLGGIGYFAAYLIKMCFAGIKELLSGFFSNYIWYIVAGLIIAAVVITALVVRDKWLLKLKERIMKEGSKGTSIRKKGSKKKKR
ncbi:hypothetical protein KY361_07575 [Candidatus Woesearchaeota archaeon]|nr:hypothetical protein [Candidatus Woesearchaeota archaeon]